MATETTVVKPRKRNDAYTGLLAISFCAFVGGSVLLYLDLEQYKEGDKLKTAPDPLKIDVPGAQLKVVPGSGTPPPPKKEPEATPPDTMPEMPPPMMNMMRADPKKDSVPVVLPALEAADARPSSPSVESVIVQAQALQPARRSEEQVVSIPDPVLPTTSLDVSANSNVSDMPTMQTEIRTIAPTSTPSLNDEPPIAPKRFDPPM
jgi:hypothetical protein